MNSNTAGNRFATLPDPRVLYRADRYCRGCCIARPQECVSFEELLPEEHVDIRLFWRLETEHLNRTLREVLAYGNLEVRRMLSQK